MQFNPMGRVTHRHVILCIAALLTATTALAQRDDLLGRSELVLRGGGMTYLGDLNNQSALGEVRPGYGGGVRIRIDNRWSVRVEGAHGTLTATHDWIPKRNLSFRSSLTEGALMAEFNFRPFGAGATESRWTPYIFGGLAAFHFNPKGQYISPRGDTTWVELKPLCTEGQGTTAYPERRPYPLTMVSMPFGVGVKLRISKSITVTAEHGFRRTWTDYIDDVSTTYVGADLLRSEVENGTVASQMADRSEKANAPGIKRGDDSLNDWYSYFNVSLSISMNTLFGWMRSKKCRN